MKQYPKTINSKQDILNLLDAFPRRAKEDLRRFYDIRKDWILIRKLTADEKVKEDSSTKIQEVKDEEGNLQERYLYEYKDNPGSKFYRFGFTEEEAEKILGI